MKGIRHSILLATCLLAPSAGWSQQVTGAITGQVNDSSGAPIANAKVTATDIERGAYWPTQSNPQGVYKLPNLPVGRYEVRAEASGFQTMLRPAFQLDINQTARVDFDMKVGAVSESVEVTSTPPLLQTESAQLGSIMEARSISSLPLATRNYNQLALLMPGAVTTSPASFNTGQSTFNSGRPYINGNREQANYYILDGMDNNEFVDNNVAYSPNVDAIQEFTVITNNPHASFGHFLGGVISVSTKSGTNQFHGNVFEFLRNDFFNANEWSRNFSSDPSANSAPAALRWNEFGGTFGGPIRKNKLFFFADYQGSRFDTPASASPVATFTEQQRAGNLSDIPGIQLHYPGTTVPMPADLTKAAICGAGQKMGSAPCISGLSPVALKVLGALPQPNLPGIAGSNGTLGNLSNAQGTYTNGDQGDLKIDWTATEKDRVFARETDHEQPASALQQR